MSYCKIGLKKVAKSSKYPDYQDSMLKVLFNTIKINPVLSLTRKAFKQESVRHIKGLSISGVQQKLSMAMSESHELVPVVCDGRYILKPSPEEFPYASENEHAGMITSQVLGIQTASCGLVSFSDGELAYITRRFDRVHGGEKLHQEDLVQGFNMPSDDKYSKSYEEAGRLILEMTKGKQAVVLDFICRVIHAYLIGNDDMHLKNVSLQKDADNETRFYDRLTPNYDCLFTDVFDTADSAGFLALDLLDGDFSVYYQRYGYYTGHDFLLLAERLGIAEKPVKNFILKIKAKQQAVLDLINCSYMPDGMRKSAADLVRARLRALLIGVSES